MLRALIVLAVIAIALLRGGSLRNFAAVNLRALPLIFAGLGLQILIFNPWADARLGAAATGALYVLSMAVLIAWVALNRAIPGMALAGAGVLMNTAAIAANGGYMPVDPQAAAYAGRLARYATEGDAVNHNSVATAEGVQLWLLTDIFPLPAGIPLANVFSLGDILLTAGVAYFCYGVITGALGRPTAPPQPPAAAPEPAQGPAT